MEPKIIVDIARVVHEANRAYCVTQGDESQLPWDEAPEWQVKSAIKGVKLHFENEGVTPEQSHESWLKEKEADGWKYGPVKDVDKKEHPCFVAYADLPVGQKVKDYIFTGIVQAFKDGLKVPA